jgi:hypothetical protein
MAEPNIVSHYELWIRAGATVVTTVADNIEANHASSWDRCSALYCFRGASGGRAKLANQAKNGELSDLAQFLAFLFKKR